MACERFDTLYEVIADGLDVSGEAETHIASCEVCRARMELARAMERVLEAREDAEPPPWFTARVMDRVAREQWRTEQLVDVGFNIAVALGAALVVAGIVGLAWTLGWFGLDRPTLQTIVAALEPSLARWAGEARTVGLAALLLTSALGLWWWAEGERVV